MGGRGGMGGRDGGRGVGGYRGNLLENSGKFPENLGGLQLM